MADLTLPAAMVEAAARARLEYERINRGGLTPWEELPERVRARRLDAERDILTAALSVCEVEEEHRIDDDRGGMPDVWTPPSNAQSLRKHGYRVIGRRLVITAHIEEAGDAA